MGHPCPQKRWLDNVCLRGLIGRFRISYPTRSMVRSRPRRKGVCHRVRLCRTIHQAAAALVAGRIWSVVLFRYLSHHGYSELDRPLQLHLRPASVPRFDLAQSREPFYIGESGDFNKELRSHSKLWPAQLLGATEVHIHLLAMSVSQRLDIETDLRRRHWTPLNYQPTPAPLPAIGGLGALAPFGLSGGGLGAALGTRTELDRALASLPPDPVPKNTRTDLPNLAPVSGLGGYRFPFETDLDWLLRKR
jgi:hypothetical protein